MIPGMGKQRTGWLNTNDENSTMGFLVINDTKDDSEIRINSITELFSEYFESTNNKRTFRTGSDALVLIAIMMGY